MNGQEEEMRRWKESEKETRERERERKRGAVGVMKNEKKTPLRSPAAASFLFFTILFYLFLLQPPFLFRFHFTMAVGKNKRVSKRGKGGRKKAYV